MRYHQLIFLSILILLIPTASHADEQFPIIEYSQSHHPVIAKNGMVSSQEAIASQIGVEILKQGGNAVDAAVAVGFALAVTLPRAGNLGGGGFMMVHLGKEKRTIAIDYREAAPMAARESMFLDKDGNVDKEKARSSYLASGVPGTVAGLLHALEKYGTMSREKVLAPAIRLAEEGIEVTYDLAASLKSREKRLRKSAAAEAIFFKGENYYQPGDTLKQKDLAWSLEQISITGAPAFYTGKIAAKLVADMKANRGLITHKDLADYRAVERKPIRGQFKGYTVVSMPPPSSGGVHLIQMLNMLSLLGIESSTPNSAAYYHLLTEVMKRAYADRSKHLGDPDFYQVPIAGLISQEYAKQLVKTIDLKRSTPASNISPGEPNAFAKSQESQETTHYSVIDRWGNAVSNTYTLNFSYGNGKVAAGTGILLNNEMDDFSAKVGAANAFGLLGGKANAIAPRKRPLSSMTPTIVLNADGEAHYVLGSPGGSTIITIVLQNILNTLLFEQNVASANVQPRIHHQWYPDTIYVEPSISVDTLERLEAMGHSIRKGRTMGSVQAIMRIPPFIYGFSDPRRPGAATIGF